MLSLQRKKDHCGEIVNVNVLCRICVLSLLDLPFIVDSRQQELIVNKFISSVDPLVVPCLQQILTGK